MTGRGPFASLFSRRVLASVNRLLVGAIRAPGKRTVTAVLRVMGQSTAVHFQHYHRVLKRAQGSALEASRRRRGWLRDVFVPAAPVVMGLEETIARRRGERISAKGIYRDPVRSSHAHFVKASGLRWVCRMVRASIPWVDRVWARPFLPVLAPSARDDQARGRRPESLRGRARQRVQLVRRWLPGRALVGVGDSADAALEWLDAVRESGCVITRLRLEAALYTPAPPRRPKPNGRPRKQARRRPTLAQRVADPTPRWPLVKVGPWDGPNARHVHMPSATAVWYPSGLPPVPIRWVLIRDPAGTFAPHALLSTRLALAPVPLLTWFVHRWQLETTFEEARAHLGLETSRQWRDRRVARPTPRVFGRYAMVTLLAAHRIRGTHAPVRTAAWYPKQQAPFSDTIALVRRCRWRAAACSTSGANADVVNIPRALLERFTHALCDAA